MDDNPFLTMRADLDAHDGATSAPPPAGGASPSPAPAPAPAAPVPAASDNPFIGMKAEFEAQNGPAPGAVGATDKPNSWGELGYQTGAGLVTGVPSMAKGMADVVEEPITSPFRNPQTGESYFHQLGRDTGILSAPAPKPEEYKPYQPKVSPLVTEMQKKVGLDPEEWFHKPENSAGRIGRAIGENVIGNVVLPGEGILTKSVQGAGQGVGMGVAQELAPDSPIAPLVGALAGHGVVTGVPAAAKGILKKAPPLTKGLQEVEAGKELLRQSENPEALKTWAGSSPETSAPEIVPGSRGTLGQVTGDMGVLARERALARDPESQAAFKAREEEQNLARREALSGLAEGDAGDATTAFRKQSDDLGRQLDEDIARSQEAAGAKYGEVGGLAGPEANDAAMRGILSKVDRPADIGGRSSNEEIGARARRVAAGADDAYKERAKGLYAAVDPDGTQHVVTGPLKMEATDLYASGRPSADLGLTAAETGIAKAIGAYPDRMPFKDLLEIKSAITTAMREAGPGTPAYGRLTRMRSALERTEDETIAQVEAAERAAKEAGQPPAADLAERMKQATSQEAAQTEAAADTVEKTAAQGKSGEIGSNPVPPEMLERIKQLAAMRHGSREQRAGILELRDQGNALGVDPGERLAALARALHAAGHEIAIDPSTGAFNFGPRMKGGILENQKIEDVEAAIRQASRRASGKGEGEAPQSSGNSGQVFYPGGRLGVKYEVVEHSDLVPSHGPDFELNPKYPQKLQPRDRTSIPARDQVNNIAAKLEPERLGKSTEINSGAPIVGPDGVVESGNGRVIAIGKAYSAGRGEAYKQWLQSQGHDVSGMKNPVLVARRTTALTPEAREYMTGSAMGSGLRAGATETAMNDAKLLTGDVLQHAADLPITHPDNAAFVRAVIQKLPADERGAFLDRTGQLSQDGVRRLQAAVTARAYGDSSLIDQAFASADPEIKGLAGGLTDAAVPWAKMRDAAASGAIDPAHDITHVVLDDVRQVARARAEGRPVRDILGQGDLLNGDASEAARALLFKDAEKGLVASRPRIGKNLSTYATEATKNEAGPRLFGDEIGPADIAKATAEKTAREIPEEGVAPTAESGAGDALETDKPLLDRGARERRAQADDEYRRYKEARAPVKGILKRTNNVAANDFEVPNAQVAGKVFGPGPGGQGKVESFLKFANGNPEAIETVKEAARSSLRQAMGSGERLDKGVFQTWMQKNADAMRAIERASPGFTKELSGQITKLGPVSRGILDNPAAAASRVVVQPGPKGGAAVRDFLEASGRSPEAIEATTEAAATSLRQKMGDGPFDPAKFETWRRNHADALREIERASPGTLAKYESAAAAQRTVDDAMIAKRTKMDEFQKSAAGKIMGLTDGADISRAMGNILGKTDAQGTMRSLMKAARGDPAAVAGLQKAIADHMMTRLVGNTEVGTSGAAGLRRDQFLEFVKRNDAALREVMTPDQMKAMNAIADDLRRSNLSDAPRARTGSDTHQNQMNEAKNKRGILSQVAGRAVGSALGLLIAPGVGEVAAGYLAGHMGDAIRSAGYSKVNTLVRDAMLVPELARTLIQRVPESRGSAINLARQLVRAGTSSLLISQGSPSSP